MKRLLSLAVTAIVFVAFGHTASANSLQETERLTMNGITSRVVWSGSNIYVASSTGVTSVVPGTNATHAVGSFLSLPVDALDLAAHGNHLVVTNAAYGVRLVDATIPTSLALVNTFTTLGTAMGVTVRNNTAYVTNSIGQQFEVVDLTNELSGLTRLGSMVLDGPGRHLDVPTGNYAYVAVDSAGLEIIDISNPAAPTKVATVNTPGIAYDVVVQGNYAYVADSPYVTVIDISVPSAAHIVGHVTAAFAKSIELVTSPTGTDPSTSQPITLESKYVIVGGETSGVIVVDISNPVRPVYRGSYNTTGVTDGVTGAFGTSAVADGPDGLAFVDFSRAVRQEITPLVVDGSTYTLQRLSGGQYTVRPFKANQRMAAWQIRACSTGVDCTVYLFALLNPLKPVTLKLYDYNGLSLNSTATPFSSPTNGANLRFFHLRKNGKVYVVVSPKSGPGEAVVYEIAKTGLKQVQRLPTGLVGRRGNTLLAFLPVYQEQEPALVTFGPGSKLRFWRIAVGYNINRFVQDTSSFPPTMVQVVNVGGNRIILK